MSGFRLEPSANRRLDDIVRYTRERWGERQADTYIRGLFAEFEVIASRRDSWRPVAADLGIKAFRRAWRRHVIYWREDEPTGLVVIISVLHAAMDQPARLIEDLT